MVFQGEKSLCFTVRLSLLELNVWSAQLDAGP
jgi:hypothetical protein